MRIPQDAQKNVMPASAGLGKFGTKSGHNLSIEEHFSYFPPPIALQEKIISSGLEAPTWSTDHVDNNKLAEGAPFLARHLGGRRRGGVHRPRRRWSVSPRPVVTCDVDRPHRRRTSRFAAAPVCRAAARPRASLRHRLLRQADRADHQRL